MIFFILDFGIVKVDYCKEIQKIQIQNNMSQTINRERMTKKVNQKQKNNSLLFQKHSQNYFVKYQKLMNQSKQVNTELTQIQIRDILQKNNIIYSKQVDFEKIEKQQRQRIVKIQYINSSLLDQFVEIQINIANFRMNLLILNCLGQSPVHQCFHSFSGSNAQVFIYQFNNQLIATKCRSLISQKKSKQDIFLQVLKQFFFLKIASILEIGPSISTGLGFDLILYQNCAQFNMEFCPMKKILDIQQGLYGFQNLKQSLKKLHLLKIVHLDIKPSNIGFSRKYQKFVLLDFGQTQLIVQNKQQLSQTRFVGTYEYSSPQMKSLIFQKQNNLVNLYYNDAYALQKSLQHIELSNFQQNIYIYEVFTKKLLIIGFKYQMLNGNIPKMKRMLNLQNEHLINKCQINILTFLLNLKPVEYLRQLYHDCISISYKEMQQFRELKIMYMQPSQIYYLYKIKIQSLNPKFGYFKQFFKRILDKSNSNNIQIFFQKQNNYNIKQLKRYLVNSQVASQMSIYQYLQKIINFISFRHNFFNAALADKYQVLIAFFQYFGQNLFDSFKTQNYKSQYITNFVKNGKQHSICESFEQAEEQKLILIKQFLNYFRVYSLTNPSNKFKQSLICTILQELIFLKEIVLFKDWKLNFQRILQIQLIDQCMKLQILINYFSTIQYLKYHFKFANIQDKCRGFFAVYIVDLIQNSQNQQFKQIIKFMRDLILFGINYSKTKSQNKYGQILDFIKKTEQFEISNNLKVKISTFLIVYSFKIHEFAYAQKVKRFELMLLKRNTNGKNITAGILNSKLYQIEYYIGDYLKYASATFNYKKMETIIIFFEQNVNCKSVSQGYFQIFKVIIYFLAKKIQKFKQILAELISVFQTQKIINLFSLKMTTVFIDGFKAKDFQSLEQIQQIKIHLKKHYQMLKYQVQICKNKAQQQAGTKYYSIIQQLFLFLLNYEKDTNFIKKQIQYVKQTFSLNPYFKKRYQFIQIYFMMSQNQQKETIYKKICQLFKQKEQIFKGDTIFSIQLYVKILKSYRCFHQSKIETQIQYIYQTIIQSGNIQLIMYHDPLLLKQILDFLFKNNKIKQAIQLFQKITGFISRNNYSFHLEIYFQTIFNQIKIYKCPQILSEFIKYSKQQYQIFQIWKTPFFSLILTIFQLIYLQEIQKATNVWFLKKICFSIQYLTKQSLVFINQHIFKLSAQVLNLNSEKSDNITRKHRYIMRKHQTKNDQKDNLNYLLEQRSIQHQFIRRKFQLNSFYKKIIQKLKKHYKNMNKLKYKK